MISRIHEKRTSGDVASWLDAIEGMVDSLEPDVMLEIEKEWKPYQQQINERIQSLKDRIASARSSADKYTLTLEIDKLKGATTARYRFLAAIKVMYRQNILTRQSDKVIRLAKPVD